MTNNSDHRFKCLVDIFKHELDQRCEQGGPIGGRIEASARMAAAMLWLIENDGEREIIRFVQDMAALQTRMGA